MKTTKTKDLRSSTMRFLIDNKAMLLALLALIAASVISPTFFSFQNLRNVIRQNTTYFVLAFGFTCVLSSGNIDLSVGLMTGMLGIFVGIMDVRMGLPLGVIIVLILLMGAFCGFMNGLIGKLIKMPMFIVTLATGQLYKGICYMISKNTPIINIRAGIKFMAQGYVFKEIPVAILIMLFVMLVVFIILNKTILVVGRSPWVATRRRRVFPASIPSGLRAACMH